jgi:hypothetical protein
MRASKDGDGVLPVIETCHEKIRIVSRGMVFGHKRVHLLELHDQPW